MEKFISYAKKVTHLNINALTEFIQKSNFEHAFILYSTEISDNSPEPKRLKLLVGLSKKEKPITSFNDLKNQIDRPYQFGILNYDLKEDFESLKSSNKDIFPFAKVHFIEPEMQIEVDYENNAVFIAPTTEQAKYLYDVITSPQRSSPHSKQSKSGLKFISDCTDKQYLDNINKIKTEIVEGNVYEMNYCRNYSTKAQIDPYQYFASATELNPTPFSCFVKIKEQFIISSSMERFLCKNENKLVSQPIKGTLANSNSEIPVEKKILYNSQKDRSENLMIVDLVRNDLNRCSEPQSVQVDELFGIYSYPTVHQMISTVSSIVNDDITFSEIIKSTFPMGSMTGAPKISAMKLIEQFEQFRRGVYSGAIGYRTQNGDFDFNVVIRSVLYNDLTNEINIPVGSAITIESKPEEELMECNVKIGKLKSLISDAQV